MTRISTAAVILHTYSYTILFSGSFKLPFVSCDAELCVLDNFSKVYVGMIYAYFYVLFVFVFSLFSDLKAK